MRIYNQPRNNGTPSNRKFKGFNFYIQSNEKLKQSNRERLLKESEVHLNEVTSSLPQPIEEQIRMGIISELDSNLNDYELLGGWNKYSVENGKDVHFDITKEYDLSLKENWVYYYPIKTEGTSSINQNTKKELIKMVVESKNRSTQITLNK